MSQTSGDGTSVSLLLTAAGQQVEGRVRGWRGSEVSEGFGRARHRRPSLAGGGGGLTEDGASLVIFALVV